MKKINAVLLIALFLVGILPMTYGLLVSFASDAPPPVETAIPAPVGMEEHAVSEVMGPEESYPLLGSSPQEVPMVYTEAYEQKVKIETIVGAIGTINSMAMGWAMFYFNVVRPRRKEMEA